ncbi:transmembrane protein 62-like [Clavelina lepadiformis]|uniref:Transmembrane protein 62 n=1 Tax=Clavelina lepadiformis TaxID=159417 RepID=A0ABP0GPK4_CLALP
MLVNCIKLACLFTILYVVFASLVWYAPHAVPRNEWKKSYPPYAGDKPDNILWFVQVSDIHISKFLDPKRGPDFAKFCSETLGTIHPELVLVTGDLTDAKEKDRIGSQQYLKEWETYNKILRETNVTQMFPWLDIRGNHDAFDVMSRKDPDNYYMKYSGDKGTLSSSTYIVKKSFGKYSFIAVDATMTPGPRRPFNFIGHVSRENLDKLYQQGKSSVHHNLTVWFSHYPTSLVSSASAIGLNSLLGQFGDVYLSGHLHDFQGLAPKMYAMHSNGFLELELADWMGNRKFRVVAIDHDLLSFTDVTFDSWPVIVVTNPKPAKFMTPKHEPIERMRSSTHIRFLLFSSVKIFVDDVSVTIDGLNIGPIKQIKGPLWTCKWDPKLYSKGMHKLVVSVLKKNGESVSQTSHFSLDDEWSTDFTLSGRIAILTNFCATSQMLFLYVTLSTLTILAVLKRYGVGLASDCQMLRNWLFKVQLLVSDNLTFYVIFLFVLNLLVGPLFVGELLTGKIGVCFTNGLLINGKLYSEYTLFVYGTITILLFYLPDILYLAYCADLCWRQQISFLDSIRPLNKKTIIHLLFLLHLILHYVWCRELSKAYGWVACLLSPSRLWWVVSVVLLLVRTWWIKPQSSRRGS